MWGHEDIVRQLGFLVAVNVPVLLESIISKIERLVLNTKTMSCQNIPQGKRRDDVSTGLVS